MNTEPTSSGGSLLGGIAVFVAILVIIGGMIYMIGDLSTQRARAVADAENARAQAESARSYAQVEIAQAQVEKTRAHEAAQVEIARAHEEGSIERQQIFALTLKSMTAENQGTLTLLSVGVLILGILQLVQALTRPRGGQ
jgi:hypothetical protein